MQNLPISTHIAVVSAAPSAPTDAAGTLPTGAASPNKDSDFSNVLAGQMAAKVEALARGAADGVPTGEQKADVATEPKSGTDAAAGVMVIGFIPLSAPALPAPTDGAEGAQGHAKPASGVAGGLELLGDNAAARVPRQASGTEDSEAELPANFAAQTPQLPGKGLERNEVEEVAAAIDTGTKFSARPEVGATEMNEVPSGWPAQAVMVAKGEPASVPASATAQAPTVSVETRVGNAGWGAELGQKVVWLVNQQQQIAHINVTPPQLGPIEIRLNLAHDQASATFVSPHAAVRDAIEAALPRLRDMLAESGLTLGNVDVSAHSFGHARQDQGQPGNPARSAVPELPAGASGLAGLMSGTRPDSLRRGEGLVDIFA
jgi:flagellar hook-length control protein FliK